MSEPAALPELPVVFRPRRTRVVLLSVGAVLIAAFCLIAIALPATGAAPWGLGDRLAFVGSSLVMFAVLALLARPKIVAEPEGVTVVNLTARRRLEWAEILRVNLRPGDPWVYLDLADGTTMPAMGIQPGAGRAQAVRSAAQLRALAESLGSGQAGR